MLLLIMLFNVLLQKNNTTSPINIIHTESYIFDAGTHITQYVVTKKNVFFLSSLVLLLFNLKEASTSDLGGVDDDDIKYDASPFYFRGLYRSIFKATVRQLEVCSRYSVTF